MEKDKMIQNMQSICKNCIHIDVDFQIRKFICNAHDTVMYGITTDCPRFEAND